MPLHPHIQAQRSATIYDLRPRFSVTLDTLPPDKALICREIAPGHWLAVVRDGAEYGEIAMAYAFAEEIPPWISPRIYGILGIVNPAVDLAAYHRTRWWGLDWPISPTAVHLLEEAGAGLVTRWNHSWLATAAA
ncbi:hypothetical protein [Nocardiopsis synnemataformans]|uniref:hypothetical protein n=1 Tax=Nocardiopsis synnemataformans TaxID=61305 RepID=UPI003EBCB9A3